MAEPVVKWAGGKRQILSEIKGGIPTDEVGWNDYHEPFVGGGALYFSLEPESGTINDINSRLMNFYTVVRDSPEDLIEVLKSFELPDGPTDSDLEYDDEENYYYQQRTRFNRRARDEDFGEVEEAALLLYLNRTCYNGLYRENRNGEFNVPIGDHSNPNWVQERRIREASDVLSGTELYNQDFGYVLDVAEEGDLVYFDPPYKPVSKTSSFVEYTSEVFGKEEQERLCDVAVELSDMGVYVVISNSPPMADLYQGHVEFDVTFIGARRHINSDADNRGRVGEIVVTNVPQDSRRGLPSSLDDFAEADD